MKITDQLIFLINVHCCRIYYAEQLHYEAGSTQLLIIQIFSLKEKYMFF